MTATSTSAAGGDASSAATDTRTKSCRLAEEYLRLGGRRRSKIDDNIVTLRQWEEDTPEAERFWKDQIETLSEQDRRQVVIFLPSINDR